MDPTHRCNAWMMRALNGRDPDGAIGTSGSVDGAKEIRRLHFIEKVGIRKLSRRFGLDRKTIRRAGHWTRPTSGLACRAKE